MKTVAAVVLSVLLLNVVCVTAQWGGGFPGYYQPYYGGGFGQGFGGGPFGGGRFGGGPFGGGGLFGGGGRRFGAGRALGVLGSGLLLARGGPLGRGLGAVGLAASLFAKKK